MKRAMRVNIIFREVKTYINEYTCPSCKTKITTHVGKETTRFKCIHCDRELIVNEHLFR